MRKFLLILVFIQAAFCFAQTDDAEAAQQYVIWIRQALDEGRLEDASAAIIRALDFSDVNSDISYLAAFVGLRLGDTRPAVTAHLDKAIDVNRWGFYNETQALILKAEQLVNMQRYSSALAALDQIKEGVVTADSAILRLKAFRGLALNSLSATEIAVFQSYALSTMNRFSRDPRSAVIFLEYLNFIRKQNPRVNFELSASSLGSSDQQVLDLILRRLPILVEIDPELAWMAVPFMRNLEEARRYTAGYRAGGFLENAAGFTPNPRSIPLALNLGLIDDTQAIEELFNVVLSVIDFNVLNDTFDMLRSEEGRDEFTRTLLDFTGFIITCDSHNGLIEQAVTIKDGVVRRFIIDKNHELTLDLQFDFNTSGIPTTAAVSISGDNTQAFVTWERYPFVMRVKLPQEDFSFRAADFNYAPISFIVLGGSRTRPGMSYPVLSNQHELSRRSLVSFCASIDRPSIEFEGGTERIILEGGIPQQAVEVLGTNIVSITEFEGGLPVIQYIDLDLDGRMETIRRFHRPGPNYPWPDPDEVFDYRKLTASSESDWTGDGRFKTGEVYLHDGSVVYQWDMDGTGTMNYSEAER